MLQLYINNNLCELKGNEKISLDYAMMSIDDISKRKGSRSYNFNLPRTVNNRRAVEIAEDVNSDSNFPYSKADARLFDNGIDIGVKYAELTAAGKNYAINLYGTTASFFELIKNKKLVELDMSEYDHLWNLTNIYGSRNNTEGYIYPIINYGSDETIMGNIERRINCGWMLPAFFLDTVLEKIVTEAGYTLDNKLLDEDDYTDNPIILPSVKLTMTNKYNAIFNIPNDSVCAPTLNGLVNIMSIDSINTYNGTYYSLPYAGLYRYGTLISTGNGIRTDDNFDCKFRLTVDIENSSAINQTVRIYISRTQPVSLYSGHFPIAQVVVSPGTQTFTLEGVLDSNNNQWYTPGLIKVIFPIGSPSVTIKGGGTFEIYEAQNFLPLYVGATVTASAFLPDLKQSDLLKDYCQMHFLLPTIDEATKTITLQRFEKVTENINEVVDWSDKLDLSEEPEVRFLEDEYAQSNRFEWDKDGDELQPQGTNGALLVENENLELDKEAVKLQFASTLSQPQLLDIPVPRIGIGEVGVYKYDKRPRMLILYRAAPNDFTDTSDFVYVFGILTETISGATAEIPLCRFIDTDFTYNLGFGNSLLPIYYNSLQQILDNYKVVTCNIRLNASDISELDFLKPVYIRYFNAYFYISKIKGYSPGVREATEVELVKLF